MNKIKSIIPDRHPLRIYWHKAKAFAAATRYGFPARHLTITGITGTDGKTTTVGMLAHILRETGYKVGAASTAFLQINDARTENDTHLTSLDPFMLQKFLRTLVSEGIQYAVVEMSSHGLVQGRVEYTWPRVSAITNTSLEHLDYHRTMEQYRRDKGIIFKMLDADGTKVLNKADDSYELYHAMDTKREVTFGTKEGDLYATNIKSSSHTCSATVHEQNGAMYTLSMPIPGTFNIENALCAIGCAMALGITPEESIKTLSTLPAIPGRMEQIDEGQDFSVFVDFAVSPQSYEQALNTLRSMVQPGKKVMVMCSSCGNRMEEKRPEIGRICSDLADVVVVTEDETYGEDPMKVLEEVWTGIDSKKCEPHKIADRKEAIEFLFKHAKQGDAVVLCGMGPFTTMTKLEGRIQWDEREVARSILRSNKKVASPKKR